MTTIKVLPEGCLTNTSAKVCGDPAEFMGALALFISKHGVVEKRKPFSFRAKILWTFAVRVKCKLFIESGEMYMEMTRRNGDGLAFLYLWRMVDAAVGKLNNGDVPESDVVDPFTLTYGL
jgi:hypothetical protein